MTPILDAAAVQALIHDGLPAAVGAAVAVEAVEAGLARVRMPFAESMLRPGRVISGPTLFAAADTAMYAAVLGHCGPELMAVTTDTSIRFLRGAPPGDVWAEARLRKLGRRLVVCEVSLWIDDPDRPVALASGSYLRPD